MGARSGGLGHHVKNGLPILSVIHVSLPADSLPIYGSGNALLGYVPLAAAQRMLDRGQAISRGTKRRVRALIAVHGNADLLPGQWHPNPKYSHNRENHENPQGVWAFRKLAR